MRVFFLNHDLYVGSRVTIMTYSFKSVLVFQKKYGGTTKLPPLSLPLHQCIPNNVSPNILGVSQIFSKSSKMTNFFRLVLKTGHKIPFLSIFFMFLRTKTFFGVSQKGLEDTALDLLTYPYIRQYTKRNLPLLLHQTTKKN